MIQELRSMVEGRKNSIPGGLLPDYMFSTSSYLSAPTSVTPSPLPPSSTSSEPQQNLKCPRCDSTNTKFCYYNNYNLTQPRHFCKTCRRYWTKGGALRNIPIGGGCRKARPPLPATRPGGGIRVKPASTDVATRLDGGYEQSSSQMLWGTPYSTQLLALLRASQLQNPNPSPTKCLNLNSMRIKDDGAVRGQCLSFDTLGQLGPGEACNPLWRSGAGQYQYHQQQQQLLHLQQQHNDMFMGEAQSQEFLQTVRSSVNYNSEQSPMAMNSACSAASGSSTFAAVSSTAASILEPLPLSGGDLGYWNQGFSWAEVPSNTGAFP